MGLNSYAKIVHLFNILCICVHVCVCVKIVVAGCEKIIILSNYHLLSLCALTQEIKPVRLFISQTLHLGVTPMLSSATSGRKYSYSDLAGRCE